MHKTTIRLSEYTQNRLKQIVQRKGLCVIRLVKTPTKNRVTAVVTLLAVFIAADYCDSEQRPEKREGLSVKKEASREGGGAPTGTVVWRAGFESGDAYPEINNFGRDVVTKVRGTESPHCDVTWQTAIKHSGNYAEREHTSRDPEHTDAGSTHRAYCFQSWRSTNGEPIPTPLVVTAWVYIEKFNTHTWTSFMTLISTRTPDYPSGSILTLDMGPSRELVVWYQPRHQGGPDFHLDQNADPKAQVPLNRWVKLQIYIDWNGPDGTIKVWQDDRLILDAPKVNIGPKSTLEKGHFGLYTGPNVNELTMYNDDLSVETIPLTTTVENMDTTRTSGPAQPRPVSPRKSVTGVIKAVNVTEKTLTLAFKGGYQSICWVSDQTNITVDGKKARLTDLKLDYWVRVDLRAEDDRYVAVQIEARSQGSDL